MEFDLLGAFLINVGEAVVDEVECAIVEELEVIGGEVKLIAPIEAQPFHVLLDALDVFGFLLLGICIVEAEVAFGTGMFPGNAEIEADGFRVAEVEIAVRFRRETGDGRLVLTGGKVGGDDFTDEIEFWGIGHMMKWLVPSDQ